MLGAIASNVLIIAALICSIIAAVNSEWLQTPDNTAQIAMYRYCGLSADDTCSPDIWFFSANAFPTNGMPPSDTSFAGTLLCAGFISCRNDATRIPIALTQMPLMSWNTSAFWSYDWIPANQ
jgi:hypothetical protein